jgi:RNA polymerase sigma-70 factor, ECF subfamily
MDAVTETFRLEARRVVAWLIRIGASFDAAEDAVQEAFAIAAVAWERDGVPTKPGAWIATAARRQLIDRFRREIRRDEKERFLTDLQAASIDPAERDDDRLRLIFACCHPALRPEDRVALTLHSVCGITTTEIASAFVVSPTTLAQRLVRAKRKIAVTGIPFAIPGADDLAPRVDAVLAVVYLVFNAGYQAVCADDPRPDLCGEAIRLARLVRLEIPNDAETVALLALMLMHDARRGARFDERTDRVLFDDQNRHAWDHAKLAEGLRLMARAPTLGPVGQYWLQAAIAAEHMSPPSAAERDWSRIAALYRRLVEHTGGSPVVELNRAIAVSMADGPQAGIALLEPLRNRLGEYSYFHAAEADLRARLDDTDGARAAYHRAIELAASSAERRSLTVEVERLS